MTGLRFICTVVVVIVWLASIIWVSLDAGKRQISPVFWTLATLISGPIGLVGYGIVRELKVSK
ncbi:MAG: hypothetical protein A2Z28_04185 [Chloroflexi bacterium RBG_16_51_9]|nr:MAG: hypothetical protein A2Z28_04185 [Chloroflexi bacterium RBG_16_51_9]